MSLVLPLAIPWVLAPALALVDGRRRGVVALAAAGLVAVVAALAALLPAALSGAPAEVVTGGWPQGIGIRLRADALTLAFALPTAALLLAAMLHAAGRPGTRSLPALVLFLAAGETGLFLAGDAFTFYVFFEVAMAAAFAISATGGTRAQIRAGFVFTVVNALGSAVLLVAIATIYVAAGTLDMELAREALHAAPGGVRAGIAALILVALGLKLGLLPFHHWVPLVYRCALPAVAAILAGPLVSVATYGLVRFGAGVLPGELARAAPLLAVLGAATLLYGALAAVTRGSPVEALAWTSIAEPGYVLVALAAGTAAGNAAAVLYAIVISAEKTLLFLASGSRGPVASASWAVGAFSVAGIPPTPGFAAKLALLAALLAAGRPLLAGVVVASAGMVLVALFRTYPRAFRGEPEPAGARARAVALALAAALVLAGLVPGPILQLSRAAVGP